MKSRIIRHLALIVSILTISTPPAWSQATKAPLQEGANSPSSSDAIDPVDPELNLEELPSQYKGVEEIVVTSQGRAQPLQDVSVSVAAFDAEYMQALGARNISDISQFTPNLEIRSVFSASNPTLFIRGVGLRDFNANSSSSVAVYNDNVYMNSPAGQLSQLFDVQSVEVLRGPQGTLYGRNASAGAIVTRARKPTGTLNGYSRITYGAYNQAEIEAAVETPIVADTLSIRIAGRMNKRDGTTYNRCGGDSTWRNAVGTLEGSADAVPRSSFEARSYNICFNEDTTLPLEIGGQNWYSGGLFPDINFGFINATGASNLAKTAPKAGVSRDYLTGNALTARTPGVAEWVNNRNDWALRSILRWQPTDEMDWQLNLHGGQSSPLARQFQMIARIPSNTSGGFQPPDDVTKGDNQNYNDPDNIIGCQTALLQNGTFCRRPDFGNYPEDGDPFAGDYNRTGKELLDLFGTSLTGEIYSGNWRYETVTAFEWNQRAVDANIDGSPFIAVELRLGNEAWQISEEVRVFWDGGNSLTVQGGVFLMYEKLKVNNLFQTIGPNYTIDDPTGGNPPFVSAQSYDQGTYAASAYGFVTWEPSEYLAVEGGLRYNYDHKAMILSTSLEYLVGENNFAGVAPFTGATNVSANGPSGDISFKYKPSDDITAYWKYSRGFKGPHINGGVIGPTQTVDIADLIKPVQPETVNAIELGLKSLLFDGRMRWNSAAYYYDYNNIQIFQLKNAEGGVPVQELVTANDADIFGIETEIDVRPLQGWASEAFENLQLFASFGYNRSRYTDFVNVKVTYPTQDIAIPVTVDNSGNTLINAPEYSFAGFVQWKLPLGGHGYMTPRFDWSYKSQVYFNPQNLEEISQDPLWLMNIRIAYSTSDDRIELAGFVLNVSNAVYRLDAIDLSQFQHSTIYAMGDPRTYGVSLSYRF